MGCITQEVIKIMEIYYVQTIAITQLMDFPLCWKSLDLPKLNRAKNNRQGKTTPAPNLLSQTFLLNKKHRQTPNYTWYEI